MHKIIEKYNQYIADTRVVWDSRFTWCGLDGKSPKYTTTIFKFFEETKVLENLTQVDNANDLFEQARSLASAYTTWVVSKPTKYTQAEFASMFNFFVGAIGEFFFVHLLTDAKSLMIPDINNEGEFVRFDFDYVSPSLKDDKDFGIDLTGYANDIPSVFQVKFWNPFGKQNIPIELYQKAVSEGILNDLIEKNDNHNVFLCWLGTEEKGAFCMKDNKPYKDKIVVIGRSTLEASVNGRYKIFWDNFYKKLNEIWQ